MDSKNMVIFSLGCAAAIYVSKEIIYPKLKQYVSKGMYKKKCNNKIIEKMEDGSTFEQAKQELINERLAQHFEIELTTYEIFGQVITQGQRVSFKTHEYGVVSGKFLGVRQSKAEGYTYNFFVWKNDDNIISGPVEMIEADTLMVYG